MKKIILIMFVLGGIFLIIFTLGRSANEEISHMEKVETGHYAPSSSISVIGTKSGDQVNFMTCAWFTRLEKNPYLFGISIQKRHFTHKAIMENKCFSINIPSVDLIPRVDAVGLVSGHEYDKSRVFDVFYGDNEKCPMIDGSIVSFECEVVNSVSLVEADESYPAAHTLFVGEVKGVWVNKNAIKNNTIYYKNLSPIIYVPSNGYWSIRKNEGRVFNPDNRKLVPKKK